jgi:hypothetical protein
MSWKAILSLLPVVLKLFLMLLEKTKDMPEEERKEVLQELDQSIDKASKEHDTSELEKWIGTRL